MPVLVRGIPPVRAVEPGDDTGTVALDRDGSVWAWATSYWDAHAFPVITLP